MHTHASAHHKPSGVDIHIYIYRYMCAGIRYSVVPSMWLPGTIWLQAFSKVFCGRAGVTGQGHVRRFRVAAVLFKVQPVVFSRQSSPSPAMDPGQHSHGTPQCILVFCPNCCTRLTISLTVKASVGVTALLSSSAVAGTPTGPAPASPMPVLPGTPGGPAPVSPIGGIMVGQESQCSRGRSQSRTISR
jgi:hypothetical protein